MKKLVFFLLIVTLVSCRDKGENAGPNLAGNFVGVYYTTPSHGDRSSFYVWVVTRKANNKLSIGYYIEDTYRIGTGGTTSRKKEIYFLDDVQVTSDSTFLINETDQNAAAPAKLYGNGTLKKHEDGSEKIQIGLDFTAAGSQATRDSEYMELVKVSNLLDSDATGKDFDYIGSYSTELSEASKTATHKWIVNFKNSASYSVDYSINDRFNQGAIVELLNSYPIPDVKKMNNQSLAIDLSVEESNSKDKIKIKALSTKLVRNAEAPPIIAVVVRIVNETQNISRMEYLELKKQ